MTGSNSHDQIVADLMTADLITLRPVDSIKQVREILDGSGLHAVPISYEGQAYGVVTLADCQGREDSELLADVVTRSPVTIKSNASVIEAAELMRSEHVHHLLITDDSDRFQLVGILSTFDLLKVIGA